MRSSEAGFGPGGTVGQRVTCPLKIDTQILEPVAPMANRITSMKCPHHCKRAATLGNPPMRAVRAKYRRNDPYGDNIVRGQAT